MAVVVLDDLAITFVVCVCIKWHPTDQVRRRFRLEQLRPGLAFQIGCDHCRQLTGPQNHDWRDKTSEWVNMWSTGCYDTLQLGDVIVDFHPLPVYYDWYIQQ
ncbi:hypothetical protein AHAS_Ahas05G0056200 [Arachis hypogaea]